MSARSIQALVDGRRTWAADDWWRLEMRAFAGAAGAQESIAVLAPPEARRGELVRPSGGAVLRSLAYMYGVVGPLTAAALMFRWVSTGAYPDEFPLATVGILVALALVVTGYSEVQERRHPRASSMGAVLALTLMRIVPGAVVLLIALTAGADLLRESPWWWLLVVIADMIVHVMLLMCGPTRSGGPKSAVDNIDVSVQEIDPVAREEIAVEVRRAVDLLAERGLIDAETHATALGAPLGHLGLTMHPPPALAAR